MNRSQYQENDRETGRPVMQKEAVGDPMRMRWAGYLIAGAGLVLVAGAFMGILPLSAWVGAIIALAGIGIAFFA